MTEYGVFTQIIAIIRSILAASHNHISLHKFDVLNVSASTRLIVSLQRIFFYFAQSNSLVWLKCGVIVGSMSTSFEVFARVFMSNRIILFTLLALFISTAVAEERWPGFDEKTANIILVAGYVTKAKYLPELVDPGCETGEYICMDPPPMKFEIEIEKVVYGELPGETVEAYTTSHYGKRQFVIEGLQPYLFLLRSDGEKYVMPRYQYSPLAYLEKEGYALPTLHKSDTPFFLPCKVQRLNKKLEFDPDSEGILLPIEHFTNDEIKRMKGFSHISKYAVRALRGIRLDDLKKYLGKRKSGSVDFRCEFEG